MERDYCYGTINNIIDGKELYIREIPCAIGRVTTEDKITEVKNPRVGETIEIEGNYSLDNSFSEISHQKVQKKLIITNCKKISPVHLILFFDETSNEFKIKSLSQFFFNSKPTAAGSIITVNSFDTITFECIDCICDHIFKIIFPTNPLKLLIPKTIGDASMNEINKSNNNSTIIGLKIQNKSPDLALSNKWTSHEKECLKKFLLIYGYGRWAKIKENSNSVLNEKPEVELKVFSNAWIKSVIKLMPDSKLELKKFLINFVNENESADEPYILPKKEDWGNSINQKAPAWGKRIQLLSRVKLIIEKFKSEKKKNKRLRELIAREDVSNEDKQKYQNEINTNYDHWDNLLNFLPSASFSSQKPSDWWTKTHDIDLLRGTYKYGYANYGTMRRDQKLFFSKFSQEKSLQDFPNADAITRRLKKLISIIIKTEGNKEETFHNKEPTGFDLESKNKIVEYLINYGIPFNGEGKSDYNLLREKLIERNVISEELGKSYSTQNFENLVSRLRTISDVVMNLKNKEGKIEDENIKDQLDPDDDGFNMTFETAQRMKRSLSYLDFIRKNIISQNYRLFDQGLKTLEEETKKGNSQPKKCEEEFWKCSIHDKALIGLVEEKGFAFLKNGINLNQKFSNIPFTSEDYLERIHFLCEFYRDYTQGSKIKRKKEAYLNTITSNGFQKAEIGNLNVPNNPSLLKKKTSRAIVERDENGNIIYPIIISPSLKILNLGRIEYERPQYHSEKNLFPIGYKAEREHQSMFELGKKMKYTCEIKDGGMRPTYVVTTESVPGFPKTSFEKDSSTGCWSAVVKAVDALNGIKRNKPTVSGTERFGLCESSVVKLLQSLPGVDKCKNYKMKRVDD